MGAKKQYGCSYQNDLLILQLLGKRPAFYRILLYAEEPPVISGGFQNLICSCNSELILNKKYIKNFTLLE